MKITKDFSTLIQREVVFAKTEKQGLNSNMALCHWRTRLATCGQTDWGHVYQLTFAQPYSGWLAGTRLMILLGLPASWVLPCPAVLPWCCWRRYAWCCRCSESRCLVRLVLWRSLLGLVSFNCWILPNTHIHRWGLDIALLDTSKHAF